MPLWSDRGTVDRTVAFDTRDMRFEAHSYPIYDEHGTFKPNAM